jgi:hypothetical protein
VSWLNGYGVMLRSAGPRGPCYETIAEIFHGKLLQ